MLDYAPVLPQPENPERSFASFEKALTQITELCQARVDYNQAQLRYVLQPQPDYLEPLVHQNIRAPVDYATRHYLAQIVLITRSKKLETLTQIQAVVDQVYLDCFSYQALESATIKNAPRSMRKRLSILMQFI